ncbi:MAG: hypothetical protein OEY64_06535 [Nitrospinota bacterium]|nr:hypothetical protein [Nitrospinota bacterium]
MLLWRKAFEKHLKRVFGEKLEVVWTDNRRTMVSFNKKKDIPVLRLHSAFETADEDVRDDLVYYLLHPRAKVPESIHTFVKSIPAHGKTGSRKTRVTSRGDNYDLRKIYNKLNKKYFDEKLNGRITWGRRVFGKKRSILFGSFSPSENLIRIHPVLDTELVPLFYLESVIHHEMVHEYLHLTGENGSENLHSHLFKKIESRFSHFELARAWQKRHIHKLLRYNPANEK